MYLHGELEKERAETSGVDGRRLQLEPLVVENWCTVGRREEGMEGFAWKKGKKKVKREKEELSWWEHVPQ